MSKLFDQLKELQQKSAKAVNRARPSLISKIKEFPAFLILTGVVLFLEILSCNVAAIKNNVLFSMDTTIQQQQKQILVLNKKLSAVQLLVDDRIKKAEAASINLNKGMQAKLSDVDNGVKSKLDQASVDTNRMEAVLQANIDELNDKLNKLQMSIRASQNTVEQTNMIVAN